MLYRIRGAKIKRVKTLSESNGIDKEGFFIYVDKKIYYFDAIDFRTASKRASTILDRVDEVREVVGEYLI